ncbi:hypothetical protein V8E54_011045 [Elaphomyces granulatus]
MCTVIFLFRHVFLSSAALPSGHQVVQVLIREDKHRRCIGKPEFSNKQNITAFHKEKLRQALRLILANAFTDSEANAVVRDREMRYFRKVDDTAAYYAAINTKNKRYKEAWLDHDEKRYWIINTAIDTVKELWLEEYRGRRSRLRMRRASACVLGMIRHQRRGSRGSRPARNGSGGTCL